jgi:hypothetical protein
MLRRLRSRRFALVLVLALALVTVFFARGSSAASIYVLHGSANDFCDRTGQSAVADYQDGYFGSELHGFWDQEDVTVTFSFPDGQIFSPLSALLLDGVVNLPPNYTTTYRTDVAGDLYFDYPITNKWPYGCYQMTAQGNSSGQTATSFFVVKARSGSAPAASPAKLAVWKNGTFEASAVHDSLVNIHGTGFVPNEQVGIWVTQPDGSVIGHPTQVASDAGNIESTFQFTSVHQTGHYTFTAYGLISHYQVFAPFDLISGTSIPSGWAQVRVAYPFPAATTQNGNDIVVSGTLFSQGEPVGIWLTLPDGSVRGLPTQVADGNGDFHAEIAIDERLPLGSYSLTAKGVNSGRLVITQFQVNGGGPFEGVAPGTLSEPQSPVLEGSNVGDGTLGGPTNTFGAENSAGPQITPQDTQGCSNPANLWTPNC